jgi:hypothetical protein
MKSRFMLVTGLVVGSLGPFAIAQAPAGAPAGATGQCNDGTYSMQATKKGACKGHQGVKAWFAVTSAAATPTSSSPTPASTPAPSASASAPAQKPMASSQSKPTTTPAPGGGPGMVWLNSSTKVYHCQGDPYYGTTKSGKYESEADAKAAGAHPAHGKPCS